MKMKEVKSTEFKFIVILFLMLVTSVVIYKIDGLTENNVQSKDNNCSEVNTTNKTLNVQFTTGTLKYIETSDKIIKEVENSLNYTVKDDKEEASKHFLDIQAISLLAITVFTYLLIYKIILLFYHRVINFLFPKIVSKIYLTRSIIKLLEDRKQQLDDTEEETKEIKHLIKILDNVNQYDYKSSYALTLPNLTTVHDTFYKVQLELESNKQTYLKLSQKDTLKEYTDYLQVNLTKVKSTIENKNKKVYDTIIYKEKFLTNNQNLRTPEAKKQLKEFKNILLLVDEGKNEKKLWQKIIEIIEQKAHHSILSELKNHSLRTKTYRVKTLNYNWKELTKETKILNVYYKIYNIISPLKNINKAHLSIKIDDELINFLEKKIQNLFQHKIDIITNLIINAIKYFLVFSIAVLMIFALISCILYDEIKDAELFSFNLILLINILVVLMTMQGFYKLKNKLQDKIVLYKSNLTHYVSHITLVMITFFIFVGIILVIDKNLIANFTLSTYPNIGDIFEKLLLPSRFEIILNEHYPKVSVFEILTYKLIFLMILAYLTFTSINFIIRKYDSIYFSDKKRTLIPPELATISINFLLAIVFLSLIYGTFFNYVTNMDYEEIKTGIAYSTNTQEANDTMSNYIPFSIFIAIVGGLLTMATRDLLENYFAGLSLQMDSPYEEHDRITINKSEMLEVRHIGIRADKFYGIKSNAEIIIPHKKLINETIVNFTLPTLDYRHELTIYVPQEYDVNEKNNKNRSIPKRTEMLLLLAIYVNTGVKIPELKIETKKDGIKKLDIEDKLNKFQTSIEKYADNLIVTSNIDGKKYKEDNPYKKKIDKEYEEQIKSYKNYLKLDDDKDKKLQHIFSDVLKEDKIKINEKIEEIWKILKKSQEDYDHHDIYHPLSKLFMLKLVETVEAAKKDSDHKHEELENEVIEDIKSLVASVLLSLRSYQKLSEKNLHHHIDKNFVARKYRMFREGYKLTDNAGLMEMAKELVHINYYYFMLADKLWKLKDLQDSLYRKREVDSTSIELLDVPRVTTEHMYSGEGAISYWKVTASITLELSEQSDEIVHHINMYIDTLWKEFDLPKYYKIENKEKGNEGSPKK